jgi:C-terminal processing protease CtpA/Prc
MLVKRFIHTDTHLFDSRLKNGPGHNDFTELTPTNLSPADSTYNGKVCVLTNRKVYSAASVFTLAMREVPGVTIVGDTTGGGLGLPVGIELPNEWQIHCAGSQLLSTTGENFELGIPPDIQVDMKKEDIDKGIDSIIEKAIEVILEKQ